MGQAIAISESPDGASDADLLEASRRGERAAFGALVARYQRIVAAVSYSRTRDHALGEDVAQETFLVAWRQLDQLRDASRLRAWLCGIARNLARKARRRGDRELAHEVPEADLRTESTPFDAVSEAEAERVVGDALARVPETYRDVLVLYYGEQLSAREIGAALGLTEATVMQRLSRGRVHLATGVTNLVERALRRPRRDFVAGVLAALPTGSLVAPSRVEANTQSPNGASMFKLALAAAALVATGTTTYLVTRSSDPPPAAASIAPTVDPATPTVKPRSATLPKLAPRPPAARPQPSAPGVAGGAVEEDAPKLVDRATRDRLGLDRGPGRGPANAPVTITMFTDLQCMFCGKSHGVIDQLFDEYPGKLRLVVKQMPVHKTAELAAEAAYAAEAQGKFWELDHLMIANPEDLSQDAILALAQQGGLDVARLRDDLERHTYAKAVAEDRAVAAELDIQGTPSFIVGGRTIRGAVPLEQFRAAIDEALKD